jgi:hypothetical protein
VVFFGRVNLWNNRNTTSQRKDVVAPRQDDPNVCKVCGEFFVVASLARCCELKHEGVVFVRPEFKPRPGQRPKD